MAKKKWHSPGSNWFGQQPHATDSMIHWSDKDPTATAAKLRAAYDKIAKAGLEAELTMLLAAKYHEAMNDAAEQEAGEDI